MNMTPAPVPPHRSRAALGGARGANPSAVHQNCCGSGLALERHRRAARVLLDALVVGDEGPSVWHEAAFVLRVRLTMRERASLAFGTLRALEPEPRAMVFAAAHHGAVAGVSWPPLAKTLADARRWAHHAGRRERKAFALASYEALSPADRQAFLSYLQGESVR